MGAFGIFVIIIFRFTPYFSWKDASQGWHRMNLLISVWGGVSIPAIKCRWFITGVCGGPFRMTEQKTLMLPTGRSMALRRHNATCLKADNKLWKTRDSCGYFHSIPDESVHSASGSFEDKASCAVGAGFVSKEMKSMIIRRWHL